MDSLQFLAKSADKLGPLYVVFGDEAFLKRRVLNAIRRRALGPDSDNQGVSTYAGDKAQYADIFDELNTLPFFQPRRIVIVEGADPFVTRYRSQLEKAVTALPASGVLVLEVKTWPSNTRLAKMVADAAAIVCKAPPTYKLAAWCGEWAQTQHQKQLPPQAADLLLDLVGADMGLLDQEILKLAIFVGERNRIEAADVDRLVGNNRAQSTWKIFDALAAGQSAQALGILDRLLDQGEESLKIMGAFSMQLRRLAQAARMSAGGGSLTASLEKAGVPPFALKSAESQLRHLGRRRANRLYDWLLEVNMGLRGDSPLPERTLLERFLLRLTGSADAKN
ncbi:MAG: DNA polymerase III subunit delta [Planctomycetes bacterium]|nr:DNA polymerase III subunit delta [Planctomycetota bacterium]